MSTPIVLNTNNVVPLSKNTYQFSFNGSRSFANHEIALVELQCFRSWNNIDGAYNSIPPTSTITNNTYYYGWPGISSVTLKLAYTMYPVVMPPGIYTISDMNAFLQSTMQANGHYMIDTTIASAPVNKFYLNFFLNTTYYAVEFVGQALPTANTATLNQPAGATWSFLTQGYNATPIVSFTGVSNGSPVSPPNGATSFFNTNTFQSVIGFTGATFTAATLPTLIYNNVIPSPSSTSTHPSYTTGNTVCPTWYQLSDFAPTVEPTNTIYVTCNVASSGDKSPIPRTLYAFRASGYLPGATVSPNIAEFLWVDCTSQDQTNIVLTLLDQNGAALVQKDVNVAFLLALRKKAQL